MIPLAELKTPEQALIAQQDAATLYQAMHRLPARHERVLRLRFGIGCEPLTLRRSAPCSTWVRNAFGRLR